MTKVIKIFSGMKREFYVTNSTQLIRGYKYCKIHEIFRPRDMTALITVHRQASYYDLKGHSHEILPPIFMVRSHRLDYLKIYVKYFSNLVTQNSMKDTLVSSDGTDYETCFQQTNVKRRGTD